MSDPDHQALLDKVRDLLGEHCHGWIVCALVDGENGQEKVIHDYSGRTIALGLAAQFDRRLELASDMAEELDSPDSPEDPDDREPWQTA